MKIPYQLLTSANTRRPMDRLPKHTLFSCLIDVNRYSIICISWSMNSRHIIIFKRMLCKGEYDRKQHEISLRDSCDVNFLLNGERRLQLSCGTYHGHKRTDMTPVRQNQASNKIITKRKSLEKVWSTWRLQMVSVVGYEVRSNHKLGSPTSH